MKKYYAYIRVSTVRQGEHGVSLQEQREAIERYAARHNLEVCTWFTEQETAAKIGRPVFNQMLRLLQRGDASGVIIHKIDRSARNLKDWAEIGMLSDAGIEVLFANESVDLSSPGGMLSADVQAVVAAYYIRNLREEVKKGYYGRLKQGLCPYPAPLGYLDCGEGKPKIIDPVQGPIIRKAFEMYATGRYGQRELTEELYAMGLRTRIRPKRAGGQKVSINVIARILSNPFYIGELRIKKTDKVFAGIHEPLISRSLFERVQAVLSGKYVLRSESHQYIFSRLISCSFCDRSLIGETHRDHVYYRCHQRHQATILKKDQVEQQFAKLFDALRLTADDEEAIDNIRAKQKLNTKTTVGDQIRVLERNLSALKARQDKLADAYLDGLLDKAAVEERKVALALEYRSIETRLLKIRGGADCFPIEADKIVEHIKTAYSLYKCGSYDEKRQMVNIVVSKCIAIGKTLEITTVFPFSEIILRPQFTIGGPDQGQRRKFWTRLIDQIVSDAQKWVA